MPDNQKYVAFKNRLVMLGFGSIGQGVLPLLLKHIDIKPEQITIITADDRGHKEASDYGIQFIENALTPDNYRTVLEAHLAKGDFLLNLSVDVASKVLIEACQEIGALYLDTCIDSWLGVCTNPKNTASQRSLYYLREETLALRKKFPNGPTTVLDHGANPGMVDHLVKQALLNMAKDTGFKVSKPASREEWAQLAEQLNIKVIHIAERDTQISSQRKRQGEFVNTWSIDGLYGEGIQPAELGWGTHEETLPADGHHHGFGCDAAIYLDHPGFDTLVRSWTPLEGAYLGFLITHGESISISDYFTVYKDGKPRYRPTCHYAYHPCDDAVASLREMIGKNGVLQEKQRLILDEITEGMDELGVLLMGNPKGIYWYGSRLTIDQARKLAPYNNATSLQVTAPVMAGVIWAMENPQAGIVEPEHMDFDRVLDIIMPYLGDVVGVWGKWTPLENHVPLFAADIDPSDIWQFKNFRVTPPVVTTQTSAVKKTKTAKASNTSFLPLDADMGSRPQRKIARVS